MKLTDTIHLLRIDFEITVSPGRKISGLVNVIVILGDEIILVGARQGIRGGLQ
ncbi:MAG: hypothetical protein MUD12_16880 [Spirochaetes bacterium]|nr:hypothetical protein [Spirochaetota bacterium]